MPYKDFMRQKARSRIDNMALIEIRLPKNKKYMIKNQTNLKHADFIRTNLVKFAEIL